MIEFQNSKIDFWLSGTGTGKMLGIMPFEVQRVFVCYFCCHIKEKSSISIPWISESCIKIKINVDFYFHTSLWCLERFYEGLQGLHKTF